MNDETPITNDDPGQAETLRRENEELRHSIRLRDAREAMLAALTGKNAHSPELLFRAVADRIEFDEGGSPANVADLVGELLRAFPEQFGSVMKPAAIDAGAGAGSPAVPLSAESLARMSPDEIRRLDWDEVRSVLAGSSR
ncbi:MAG TPA: hypothetical protein PKD24_14665 [Pyrinomonadaceae bacterium]|nr:hypothetical protein [Pyrinomonadaceae bacterium]HMP66616.1 hypothetical protein [Pyrinomonadaceae bacterium]